MLAGRSRQLWELSGKNKQRGLGLDRRDSHATSPSRVRHRAGWEQRGRGVQLGAVQGEVMKHMAGQQTERAGSGGQGGGLGWGLGRACSHMNTEKQRLGTEGSRGPTSEDQATKWERGQNVKRGSRVGFSQLGKHGHLSRPLLLGE